VDDRSALPVGRIDKMVVIAWYLLYLLSVNRPIRIELIMMARIFFDGFR
jgi:hypothetical protein